MSGQSHAGPGLRQVVDQAWFLASNQNNLSRQRKPHARRLAAAGDAGFLADAGFVQSHVRRLNGLG
jgi:hypothetical protein